MKEIEPLDLNKEYKGAFAIQLSEMLREAFIKINEIIEHINKHEQE